jgi:Flp pilus assembly protein TadD
MSSTAVQKHPRYRWNAPVDVVTVSAEIQQWPAENISLGGIFLRTNQPPPLGSFLRLRLRSDNDTIGLLGKVVHIIDAATAAEKAHPPGIGVQFENVPPKTSEVLKRFVDGLALAALRERAFKAPVHFASSSVVQVRSDRATLQQLWENGLKHGGVFAEGEAPPLGSPVRVFIGPVELNGEVVTLDPFKGGAVTIRDLDGPKREAIATFVDGTAPLLFYKEIKASPQLTKVLAAARRLFTGLEDGDPAGALGLPVTATTGDIQERARLLKRVFIAPPEDASPPQKARLEAACRALQKVEDMALQRAVALRKEAELAQRPPPVAVVDEGAIRELLAEAAALERTGERVAARKLLVKALDLAPGHEMARKRLADLDSAIDLARACDLLGKAEVFIQGVGMKNEAIDKAREASSLSKVREVRLRAVRVLAKAGDPNGATELAEELLVVDPKDVLALNALLVLHERASRWAQAARVGEALLRLKPGDSELQKRVKAIVEHVRRPSSAPPPQQRPPSGRWKAPPA